MARIALHLTLTVSPAWAGSYTEVSYPHIEVPPDVQHGQSDEVNGNPCVWVVGERGVRVIQVTIRGRGWTYAYVDHDGWDERGLHALDGDGDMSIAYQKLDELKDGSEAVGYQVQDVTGFIVASDFESANPRLAVLVCTESPQDIAATFSHTCTTDSNCREAGAR